MKLAHLTSAAIAAHNWTSFSPEKRGADMIASYSAELDRDLDILASLGADPENLSRYSKKFESIFTAWIGAKSRCASSMIAGPSNFPVNRARKANDREHNHYLRFNEWREKVIAAYNRTAKKRDIEEKGGELAIAREKLASLELLQTRMKNINALHKMYLKKGAAMSIGSLPERDQALIKNYVPAYTWEKHPFAPYRLTNNNAMIKNTRDRIAILEAKEKMIEEVKGEDLTFTGGRVEINGPDDRIRIYHDEIPNEERRRLLKGSGFNWSPFNKCWQRKITDNARRSTERITGVKINC